MKSSEHVISMVERVRHILRRTVIERRVASAIVIVLPILVLLAGLDRLLRFPSAFRWAILFGICVLVVWVVRRHLIPAIRFRPTLVQVALRVEAHIPSLVGRLASGVDFSTGSTPGGNALADRSLRDLDSRIDSGMFANIARTAPAHRLAVLAGCLLGVVVTLVAWMPDAAQTASIRMFAPWLDVRWPARTQVESLMPEMLVHPRGEPIALAANLVKGTPGRDRVSVRVRRFGAEVDDSWRTLVMTPQSEGLHERIVDTDVDLIEYQFTSSDWETSVARIELVPAPRLRSATVMVEPPAYAARLGGLEQVLDVGVGRRSRLDRAILEGSTVELSLELERPVPVPVDEAGEIDPSFVDRTLISEIDLDPEFEIDAESPERWSVRWTVRDSAEVEISLVDEHGIENIDPIRYRFPVVRDRAPSVTIVDPTGDRRVTSDAVITVAADAIDDVGLDRFVIEATLETTDQSAQESTVVGVFTPREDGTDLSDASISTSVSIEDLGAEEGESIALIAVASDLRPVEDPEIRSAIRRLYVVSDSIIVDEIQSALAGVRRTAIRLEDDQAGLEDAVRERGPEQEVVRGQERLGERIETVGETLEAIERRRRENQIADETLADLLDQARARLDAASAASDEATNRLDRANRSEGETAEADIREAAELQQEIRDELTDLAATLDRGEDAWVVSRQIERLAEDLADLQERTADLAEQTMGRDRSNLSEEERRAVDDVAREQSSLAERAEELIEDLEERSESLAEIDPNESSALEEAAEQARREGLDAEMREAADAAQENRLRQAGQSQQRASAALERMQETMEEIRKAKVEELRRRMESLVESLEALVSDSEDGLAMLARIGDPTDRERIDAHTQSLIRLQRNTMSVAVDAGRADDRIGRLVGRASDRQGEAIARLRTRPSSLEESRDAQEQALQQLQEALDLARAAAERLAQQQAAAERARLLEAYRGIRDRQVGVQIETEEIVPTPGEALGRRDRITARRLAGREAEIGDALDTLVEEFTEVEDSLVFSMTHRRLDEWLGDIEGRLRDGVPSAIVVESQRMVVEAISGLIESLEDSPPPDDPFGQQQAGGGGAPGEGAEGGPQPLIPPIAELKMLKSMQKQILEATMRIDMGRLDGEPTEGIDARLADLSDMQADLHGVATALITSMETSPLEGRPDAGPKGGIEEMPMPEDDGGIDLESEDAS